jgi:hypothetical protein
VVWGVAKAGAESGKAGKLQASSFRQIQLTIFIWKLLIEFAVR